MSLDLFAAGQAQAEAIERAAARVNADPPAVELVQRVTLAVGRIARAGDGTFTADLVAQLLDEAGVKRELKVRRRLSGTVINAGRGTLWKPAGAVMSKDPKRHARYITLWRVTEAA